MNFLFLMPELAEVFIMTNNLKTYLKGILSEITVSNTFQKRVKIDGLNLPLTIYDIQCKGKMTYIILTDNAGCKSILELHYGMTGNIRNTNTDKHCHISFKAHDPDINTPYILYYHDIRRFGSLTYYPNTMIGTFNQKLDLLGLDPLKDELNDQNTKLLIQKFRGSNCINICKALMSQNIISGIGNYMKAEILYNCQIHPLAIIKHLSDEVLIQIFHQAKILALTAVQMNGASLYTYTGLDGSKSDFKSVFNVYGRSVDPNGHPVKIIRAEESSDKRTTHWVPQIQVLGLDSNLIIKPKITFKLKPLKT